MRIMTASAIKLPARSLGVLFLFFTEGMTSALRPLDGVWFRFHVSMTVQAYHDRFFHEQRDLFRRVWIVTGDAHAAGYGSMHIFLAELRGVMAGKAELRRC